MASVEERVARCAAQINTLILENKTRKEKTKVREVKRILREHDLIYYQTLTPEFCCTHPDNRFGQGLTPSEVHTLLDMIIQMGWDQDAIEGRPMGSEMPPPGTHREKLILAFNEKLVLESAGHLAPVGDPKVAMLATSHTMAGLKAVKCGAKAMNDDSPVRGADGKLSPILLQEVCPEAWKVCDSGIKVETIRSRVHVYTSACARNTQSTRASYHESRAQCVARRTNATTRARARKPKVLCNGLQHESRR